MSASVFLSHSSREVEVARGLKAQLQRVGLTAFLAPDDMHGADAWPEQLSRAVEECDVFVVLLSAAANGSEHVAREVSIAVADAKPILVLRLDDSRPEGPLRYLLELRQQIDIFPGPLERHFERVLSEVRAMATNARRPSSDATLTSGPGTCPTCGTRNPPQARFCSNCSTVLPSAADVAGDRRIVSILFCDLVGSTALGEQLDAEVMRRLMARYFAEARKIVVHHGGMVEKFIGDAVMAVFGLPALHEDDALRAVRAAVDIRGAISELGREMGLGADVAISLRIGVTTGEVVAGDPAVGGTLITGDAVNTAARLEQAAEPGQILIGALTRDLVRDAATVELVPPVEARGKGEPIEAYRLVSVLSGAAGHARHLDAPMVGRERELRGLRQAYDDAVTERSCRLFTVLGSAGVGKSRLVAEFLGGLVGQARTLEGRCLPYGDGITYWPVREIVHAAAGIDEGDDVAAARAKIAGLLAHERESAEIERCLARAVGLSDEAVAPEELTWGIRRFLEVLAEEKPLVVVFDDIQWGEPTFLDLIEHVGDWTRDAPLLLICPARPELLEVRPGWAGGKLNATSVLLEPLPADAARQLIEGLGAGQLPTALQDRIAAAAEGNALFIEEMINMLRADGLVGGDGTATIGATEVERVRVPPTIRVLLAARLDQLLPDERAVAERASVIGRVFERRAVSELSPETDRLHLHPRLLSLVRKEMVRPDRSDVAEEAYRFRHLLIRDAAYEALPKSERAVLHEQFARWLIRVAGDRTAEYEEVIAFHLDQAQSWRLQLGERGEVLAALAAEAADWYVRAARRAGTVLDLQSAKPHWERAVALLVRGSEAWLDALHELAGTMSGIGDKDRAAACYAELEAAAAESNPALAAMARIGALWLGRTVATTWENVIEGVIHDALPILDARGDERYLAEAYTTLAQALTFSVNPAAYEAARSGLSHAQASKDVSRRRDASRVFVQVAGRSLPPAEARAAITESVDIADFVGGSRCYLLSAMALLDGRESNLELARAGLAESIQVADRFRLPLEMVVTRFDSGRYARWSGDFSVAEPLFRRAFELAVELGVSHWVGYTQSWLAMSLLDGSRIPEAESILADFATHRGEDWQADAIASFADARLLAARDQLADATAMLHDAIDKLPATALVLRSEAHVEEIRMLRAAGLNEPAAASAAKAITEIGPHPARLFLWMINDALTWTGEEAGAAK